MLKEQDKKFAAEFLEKVEKKLSIMADNIGANFPYTSHEDGFHPLGDGANIYDWTTPFWPGMMWLMYVKTGDEKYRKIAEGCEDKLDKALDDFREVQHDVGFIASLTCIANYKLTGNERSLRRAEHKAHILAGRYNPAGKFIKAWDTSAPGRIIIDCMMNLPLLYWASKTLYKGTDPRFDVIGRAQADKAMEILIRGDGSANHMANLDPITGECLALPAGQGYAEGSCWTRGQGWALYGFVLSYLNTGETKYLDVAKQVAHYFMVNVEPGKLPAIDFRSPKEPELFDASAASIAACGLIEIANSVSEYERDIYLDGAMRLLRALYDNCDFTEENLVLLNNCSSEYHAPTGHHKPWIYGDYYLVEALMKLYGNDGRFTVHE